ncbi:MAG: hypothetical protein GDA49_08230 [Rhodospirillales bacterium]|nr:hypothetical protein [Rhodospirillales bacterium]
MHPITPCCLKTLRIGLPVILCLMLGVGGSWPPLAKAQSDEYPSLFRDAKTDDTIRFCATPLFEAAGYVSFHA